MPAIGHYSRIHLLDPDIATFENTCAIDCACYGQTGDILAPHYQTVKVRRAQDDLVRTTQLQLRDDLEICHTKPNCELPPHP